MQKGFVLTTTDLGFTLAFISVILTLFVSLLLLFLAVVSEFGAITTPRASFAGNVTF